MPPHIQIMPTTGRSEATLAFTLYSQVDSASMDEYVLRIDSPLATGGGSKQVTLGVPAGLDIVVLQAPRWP